MKWKAGKTYATKIEYYTSWHKWFAWYPITIFERNGRKVKLWLEYIERKGRICMGGIYESNYYEWEYREI